jgi:hypothetical protein
LILVCMAILRIGSCPVLPCLPLQRLGQTKKTKQAHSFHKRSFCFGLFVVCVCLLKRVYKHAHSLLSNFSVECDFFCFLLCSMFAEGRLQTRSLILAPAHAHLHFLFFFFFVFAARFSLFPSFTGTCTHTHSLVCALSLSPVASPHSLPFPPLSHSLSRRLSLTPVASPHSPPFSLSSVPAHDRERVHAGCHESIKGLIIPHHQHVAVVGHG